MIETLPTELLDQIVSYLPDAKSVGNLSRTCKPLHAVIEKDCWRSFVQARFPTYEISSHWRDAAHSLTTSSRAFSRRAFIASYVKPSGNIWSLVSRQPVQKWTSPKGQTMGFQPSIDSYETFTGNTWTDRREVLAWSAGSELLVRSRLYGRHKGRESGAQRTSNRRALDDDELSVKTDWWTFRPSIAREGIDDPTSVQIVRPLDRQQKHNHVVTGTASGNLRLLRIPAPASDAVIKTNFQTRGRSVRSTTLRQRADTCLLAANLSDAAIALYPVGTESAMTTPISEISEIPRTYQKCRIWSLKFINDEQLAVGLGPSVTPIQVYNVGPTGFAPERVRTFNLSDSTADTRTATVGQVQSSSSIYPIEPLPNASGSTRDSSIFLSGGYDGNIRLHDMRSPVSVQTIYKDSTDESAVYSLLARGLDRFVAGTARHGLLKFFDLRMTGASDYHYTTAVKSDELSTGEGDVEDPEAAEGDWNAFVRQTATGTRNYRSGESPIYSLSSPSATSPLIYAGVENALVQFAFTSINDRHPDPILAPMHRAWRSPTSQQKPPPGRGGGRNKHHKPAQDDTLQLAMYSAGDTKAALKLRVQQDLSWTVKQKSRAIGLDERWTRNDFAQK